LRGNTSAEDITVALREIEHDFINVKQMIVKRLTPEGGVTRTTFPPFIVNVAKNQKAREIFKLATRCNTVIKMEPLGRHTAAIVSVLATSGCTAGRLFAACGVGVGIAIISAQRNSISSSCCNCDLQDGESLHPARYRGRSRTKQELQRRRNLRS
jgi:hypothetical protein